MRLCAQHTHQNDATSLKGLIYAPENWKHLDVQGIIKFKCCYNFFAVFRKIWANGSLECHDDLFCGPLRSKKVIT